MSREQVLSDLDLAALVSSRVCHDIISPVGAIVNGLEVLDGERDEDMRQVALDLIARSVRVASAKLQFCRLAFGAAGSAGAEIDLGDAEEVTRGFIGHEKVEMVWRAPHETRPKNEVKLLLNLILTAISTIPRGGRITVEIDGPCYRVTAEGMGARIAESTSRLISGTGDGDDPDPRSIQAYHAYRLAEACSHVLQVTQRGEGIAIEARPRAEAAA